MTDDILARLSNVDACAVCDALDALGIDGAAAGLHSVSVPKPIVGRAVTMDLADCDGTPSARHLGTEVAITDVLATVLAAPAEVRR
jgi:4-hydroxy-4-methyl-2-oxoglutarate aldolase